MKLVEYHDVVKEKALILEEAVTEAARIAAIVSNLMTNY